MYPAPLHKGIRLGGAEERLGPARGDRQAELGGDSRGAHDGVQIVEQRFRDGDLLDGILELQHVFWPENRRNRGERALGASAAQQQLLLLLRGIAEGEPQEESIHLRLGQRIGSEVLDGVLRRHDHERVRQLAPLPLDGHGSLVHGFEQRRLRLGRCPVDLVGEHDVREDRAGVELEAVRRRVEDGNAEDVRRKRVARKLNSSEIEIETLAKSPRERGLAHAGHVLDQDVSAGEQRREQHVHNARLAAVDERDVVAQAAQGACRRSGRGHRSR